MVTRGFSGRRPTADIANRLPPGQFKTDDFPVLSKGPVPRIDLAAWRFTLSDGPRPLKSWSWNEFLALPRSVWAGDIHCVTTWSKFDTRWEGVTIDALLADAGIAAPTPWLLGKLFTNRFLPCYGDARAKSASALGIWERPAGGVRGQLPDFGGLMPPARAAAPCIAAACALPSTDCPTQTT